MFRVGVLESFDVGSRRVQVAAASWVQEEGAYVHSILVDQIVAHAHSAGSQH